VNALIGQPVSRVDGPAKVTGTARYAGEFTLENLAHAALVTSTIPAGRITRLDTRAAELTQGVLAVVSHLNAPPLPYLARPEHPESEKPFHVFESDEILFSGQPIAVVVATTLEQARHAAGLIAVEYAPSEPHLTFAAEYAHAPGENEDSARGDADAALAAAPVRVDATYHQPREHHSAIEPHATIAEWSTQKDGERLTLYDKTQWVANVRTEMAYVFGLREDHVRVISPFVGGAFGSALRPWPHVVIAALAARIVKRPVRVELTRRELFSEVGYRPCTEQRLRLGADGDGRLAAIIHETTSQTATYEEYTETTLKPARTLYACDHVRTRYRVVDMNTNAPCPMRAPGIVTGVLGLEMAMDELAAQLAIDPVELRLRNHAEWDLDRDRPWSSKELRACYEAAAERFGWARRNPKPRSMREGPTLIGYGMASAIYGAHRDKAAASATLFANGSVLIRTASCDMGPGTYTSMSQIAAEILDVPIGMVRFELGDSQLPPAPVHGGSITMASVGTAVAEACGALRDQLSSLSDGEEPNAAVLRKHGLSFIEATGEAKPGEETESHSSFAFGAVFAEVRVDEDLGTVRVPRLVGAYDVGRVINPKTARSQCIGGMVGGIGMALLEEAEWDSRFGRVMNGNLAEYLVPVCADVQDLDVTFVPSDDRIFNPLGAKGLAEIAICGVAPAIANAVWHATGKRIRDLPITPERLLI
jgi:xanthine dehydrogenase YagR molybdenum-binding subunit